MLLDFLDQFFLQPIRVESGYNLINTTVYAVVALVLLYIIYRSLRYFKFNIDIKFFIAMVPFVVLGSSIRAFVDHNYIARGFWWISPGIWMFIAIIFLITLFVSHLISKENYWKISLIAGSIYSIVAYILVFNKIAITNFVGAVVILTLFSAAAIALYSIGSTFKQEWITDNMHFIAISGHLFDATNTFIIVDFFGGVEKHPIPRFFIEHFGTGLAFYPLKLLVLLPAIYLIFTELKHRKQLRNFLLISIAVLGFAEGLRNFISLVLA